MEVVSVDPRYRGPDRRARGQCQRRRGHAGEGGGAGGHEMDLIEGAIEEAVEEAIEEAEQANQAAGEPGTAVPGDGDMPKTGQDAAEDGGAADEPGMAVPGDGDIPVEAQAEAPAPAAPAEEIGDGSEPAPEEAAGETKSLADQVAGAVEGYASPTATIEEVGGDEEETVSESPGA
ncbi:hypothetical protein THAOC_10935, partial [Thalassiosira oceanica]